MDSGTIANLSLVAAAHRHGLQSNNKWQNDLEELSHQES
jgi:hypothetical protein